MMPGEGRECGWLVPPCVWGGFITSILYHVLRVEMLNHCWKYALIHQLWEQFDFHHESLKSFMAVILNKCLPLKENPVKLEPCALCLSFCILVPFVLYKYWGEVLRALKCFLPQRSLACLVPQVMINLFLWILPLWMPWHPSSPCASLSYFSCH